MVTERHIIKLEKCQKQNNKGLYSSLCKSWRKQGFTLIYICVCLDKETEKRSKRVVNCWARWGVGQWGWKGVGVKALFIHFDC